MKQIKLTCMAVAVLMIGSVLSGKLFAETADGTPIIVMEEEKPCVSDFEFPGFNPHTDGTLRNPPPTPGEEGDFRVENFATGASTGNYFWRGYLFTPSRNVTAVGMWGGSGPNCFPPNTGALGFQGGIWVATITGTGDYPAFEIGALVANVDFTDATDAAPEYVAFGSSVALTTGTTYFIGQGSVGNTSTCHYQATALDYENLQLGSIIIDQWYPQADGAYILSTYAPYTFWTNNSSPGMSETTNRTLVGFRYLTTVEAATLGAAATTIAAVVSNDLVLDGLLENSGVPGSGDGANTDTALYFEVANNSSFTGSTLYPANIPDGGTVNGPQTNVDFQTTVIGWNSPPQPDVDYYARAVAINEYGRVDGDPITFNIATLEADPTSLTNFEAITGTPSPHQTFLLTGSNLSANAVVTAPANFEVSSNGTDFSPNVTIPHVGGTIDDQTIWVRITGDAAPLGTVSDDVNITSASASANVSVSGTRYVLPSLTVDPDDFDIIENHILSTPYTTQSFLVSGEGLYADVIITAPDDFEVSTDGIIFSPSLTLNPVPAADHSMDIEFRNVIVNQEIFFRVSEPQAGTGLRSGLFEVASTGADPEYVSAGVRLIPLLWISVFVMILAITAFIVYRWRKTNVAMK